jgi:hypothetical protein
MTPLQQLRATLEILESQERKIGQLAIAIEDIHEVLLDRDYYSVKQWCQSQRIRHTPALLSMWGKEATALSTARSIEIKRANENEYNVGRYHKSILATVCVAKPRTNGQLPLIGAGK